MWKFKRRLYWNDKYKQDPFEAVAGLTRVAKVFETLDRQKKHIAQYNYEDYGLAVLSICTTTLRTGKFIIVTIR